ncbi:MAG: NAD-dependent epimerase/dehydratase family protein [Bryobacteraceae bacterium]|jgi:UDP-glucose 4-epimerase
MRVLVTGCAGFIGSHLSERFLAEGHTVVGVDALTDYYDPRLKRRNLRRCLDSDQFRFVESLVEDAAATLVPDADVICHLAAQPGVRSSWGQDFETYVRRNLLATQSLLEQVGRSGRLKRLVYASSSSVYGNCGNAEVTEEHPKNPYSPYGVTKFAGENLCSAYAANHGFPITSLRFFTVCGPRQRPDMMFHRVIVAALTRGRFAMYGDGTMERNFTSVFDVVDALILAAETDTRHSVFNIAGEEVVSMLDAIAAVEDLAGAKVLVERQGEQRGDVRRTSADISRAKECLGYSPKRTLRDSIRQQIAEVEALLSESAC